MEDHMPVENTPADDKPLTVKEVRDQLATIQQWVNDTLKDLADLRPDDILSMERHDRMIGPRPLARGCMEKLKE
jgi:hypothetical protein